MLAGADQWLVSQGILLDLRTKKSKFDLCGTQLCCGLVNNFRTL